LYFEGEKMTDLLKISVCSGSAWNDKNTKEFTIDDKYISKKFFHGSTFNIDHIDNVDGVDENGYYVHPSGHRYHGSGSLIIHNSEKSNFPIWIQVEYDTKPSFFHRKGKPHLNLYLHCNNERRMLAKRVHAVDANNVMVKLTDLVNDDEFSNHCIRL
jgi:hypothetical protein